MRKIISFIIVLALIFSSSTAFAAKKKHHRRHVHHKRHQVVKKITLPKKPVDPETQLYQHAQNDLNRNFYEAYRVTERLARANKLNEYSWRIVIPKTEEDYEVNASTESCNTIVLKHGFIDAFTGEPSALAFVVAHEMAHQIHKDIPRMQRSQEQAIKKLKDEFENAEFNTVSGNKTSFIAYDILQYYYLKKFNDEKKEAEKK